MSLVEEKQAFRKDIKRRLAIYSYEEMQKGAASALYLLEKELAFVSADVVLMYWSLPDEIYTHDFIEKWSEKKTILLPFIQGNSFEAFVFKGKENLIEGPLKIMQPQTQKYEGKIDLAIIPGRAFDHAGHRLGRGKGFYDHFLKDFSGYKIGFCFNFQLQDYVPYEPFDVGVDMVITSVVSTHLF